MKLLTCHDASVLAYLSMYGRYEPDVDKLIKTLSPNAVPIARALNNIFQKKSNAEYSRNVVSTAKALIKWANGNTNPAPRR